MNVIQSFEDLKKYQLPLHSQYWFYVILINPRDVTKAGQIILDNLNIFNLDSGEDCHYFIPGFANTGKGLFRDLLNPFNISKKTVSIPGFGNLAFYDQSFVEFYKELESRNNTGWRYSGECEFLLFNISLGNKIKLNNFASYNLDDIVRNNRSVSEFIRTTINVGKDAINQSDAKRKIDEKFYEMIIPDKNTLSATDYEKGWELLYNNGFCDNSYYFISYSTKDFRIVSEIRNNLCNSGLPCWMAPFDIPNGTNYAWIIEHAIKHANKFVLMLSEDAAESIWVGKELKRAISMFQYEFPEKLCIVWLKEQFSLQNTPLALPLEDIQININLQGNSKNYFLIADKEKQTEIKSKEKIKKYKDEINEFLSPVHIISNLKQAVSRIFAIAECDGLSKDDSSELYLLCEQINQKIDLMEQTGQAYDSDFFKHFQDASTLIKKISQMQ